MKINILNKILFSLYGLFVIISCQNNYPKFYNIEIEKSNSINKNKVNYISMIFLAVSVKSEHLEMDIYVPKKLALKTTDTVLLYYKNKKYKMYMNPINQRFNQDKILTFVGEKPEFHFYLDSKTVKSDSKIFIENLEFELKNKEELFIDNRTIIKVGIYKEF